VFFPCQKEKKNPSGLGGGVVLPVALWYAARAIWCPSVQSFCNAAFEKAGGGMMGEGDGGGLLIVSNLFSSKFCQ